MWARAKREPAGETLSGAKGLAVVVSFSGWRSFTQNPFERQKIELPIAFYACCNVAVPKSICRPFPACRGFNDPAPLSTSNHIQTTFKPSSNEHSSPYSKFHILANCQLLLANYNFPKNG